MSRFWPLPNRVVQSSTWWCWAACMEMLSRAHPEKFGWPPKLQEEWVANIFSNPGGSDVLNRFGGFDTRRFPEFCTAIRLSYQVWIPSASETRRIDWVFLEQKLQIMRLLAIFPTGRGTSHFVVITGVDGSYLHYTDPAPGPPHKTIRYSVVERYPLAIAWKA